MYFLNFNPLGNEGNGGYVGVIIFVVVFCIICHLLFERDDH